VGHTPLIRLRRVVDEGAATVWGKAEQFNPGGSVKDRVALAMIEAAERDGRLRPGQLVVEPTSGNTGIGLALACAVKGYKLALAMPESMSLERRALLEAYGAEIILTPAERVMEGAIEAAEELVEQRGAFMPMQFSNPANPARHAETTARELLERFADTSLDAFVAAVGTGGTVSGVGRVLRAERPGTRIVAVEPAQSPVLSGGEPGPTKIQGIGAGFVPGNVDRGVIDDIVQVSNDDAFAMARKAAAVEGLPVGISSGAALTAGFELASRPEYEGKLIVVIIPSFAERYLSTALFEGL
jgi:cysteine synthase A